MEVKVKLFATLSRFAPETRAGFPRPIELPEGSTLAHLVSHLGLPDREVKVVYVNALARDLSYVLQPGDEIGIFPPIAGG
jgi:sulfur-carrier protein